MAQMLWVEVIIWAMIGAVYQTTNIIPDNFDGKPNTTLSAPAWDGTGREFDSWQCRIYIPCSWSLRLLGSLRGSLGTYGLTQKLC